MTIFLRFSFSTFINAEFPNFSLLRDFTCAVGKDELKNHPELQTIKLIELENDFPSNFSDEILKCLPDDVTKLVIRTNQNGTFNTTKNMMVVYIASCVRKVKNDKLIFTSITMQIKGLSRDENFRNLGQRR